MEYAEIFNKADLVTQPNKGSLEEQDSLPKDDQTSLEAHKTQSVEIVVNKNIVVKDEVLPILPIIKTFNDENNLYIYLTNPNLLIGESLMSVLYKTIQGNQIYQDYSSNKLITVSVTFSDEDLKSGRLTNQHFGLHKYIAVNNDTKVEQYLDIIMPDVQEKYIDNDYLDKTPRIIRVTIKNMDMISGSTINVTKSIETGQIKYTIESKSSTNKTNPFSSGQKRSVHTKSIKTNVKKNNRNLITPIKLSSKNTKLNSFSTLDIETISINNVEVPVAISLVLLEYNSKKVKYFSYFTFLLLLLLYPNSILIKIGGC